jgi:hypothetical protein
MCLGCAVTTLSGWFVTMNIVTPDGGGIYWGLPFHWKSRQFWIGISYGFQYNWLFFVLDTLIYLAFGYFVFYLL